MLSIPDEHGFCSFGISVDYTKPAADVAKLVIAEVTPHMPRTLGNSFIHVSQIDYLVECDSHPIAITASAITPKDETIGHYCADLIKDGDCLQLGIGALPDAILGCLKHKKNLGIHTEMFSDGVVELVNESVIDCSRKNFHSGKMVATFFMGTEKLYKFVHNNPMVEMFSVDYTNNPSIIAQNDNMVSINSALEVDLIGQVVADTIGYMQYSGAGGQADFVRGTAWSNGGRSIIALQSTAAAGTISRIRAHITEGAAVTTDRTDICYVVTEYGVADLVGKTVAQRAKALIGIAHPDFRADLKKEFQWLYYK
jgi:4-hydroxybutyrate CoA-transferase